MHVIDRVVCSLDLLSVEVPVPVLLLLPAVSYPALLLLIIDKPYMLFILALSLFLLSTIPFPTTE